jgi:hypothetical protein
LRGYTRPLNLEMFDEFEWTVNDEAMDRISRRLDQMGKNDVMTSKMVSKLSLVDRRSFLAGLLGANERGLFHPEEKRKKDL